MVAILIRKFFQLSLLAVSDIVCRYKRTKMGLLWVIIPFQAFVFPVSFVFSQISNVEFLVQYSHTSSGFAVFMLVRGCILDSLVISRVHRGLIEATSIDIDTILVRTLLYHVAVYILQVVILLTINFSIGANYFFSIYFLFLVPLIFTMFVLYVLMTISAYYGSRSYDLQYFFDMIFSLAMLVTPVLWVSKSSVIDSISLFNPLNWILYINRQIIIYGYQAEIDIPTIFHLLAILLLMILNLRSFKHIHFDYTDS